MRDVWVQLENAEGREFLVRPDEVAALEASTKDAKGNELTGLIIAGVSFANVVKGTPRQIANKLHEALNGDSVGQPKAAPPAPSSQRDTEPPPAVDDKADKEAAAGDRDDDLDETDELDEAAAELASELAANGGDANAAQ